MPDAKPAPRLVTLYRLAQVCQVFTAYKIADLRQMSGSEFRDVWQATQLIDRAKEIYAAKQG